MKNILKLRTLPIGLFFFVIATNFCQAKANCSEGNDNTKYDVIIVLGCPATSTCNVSPIMKTRVNKGIELFKKGLANKIMFSGSAVANNCNEAKVMSVYAHSEGLSYSSILEEKIAKNTYENAYYTVKKMKEENFKSAAIVTSDFHIERACNIFANYNIIYTMYSAKMPQEFSTFDIFMIKSRESLALFYHLLFGYKKDFGLKN